MRKSELQRNRRCCYGRNGNGVSIRLEKAILYHVKLKLERINVESHWSVSKAMNYVDIAR